jgi:hypothetical protein
MSRYCWIQRLRPSFSSCPEGVLDLNCKNILFMLDNKIIKKNISKNNQEKLLIKKIIKDV